MLHSEPSAALEARSDLPTPARSPSTHPAPPGAGGAADALARAVEAIDAARGNVRALQRAGARGSEPDALALGFLQHNLTQARRWTALADHPVLRAELSELEADARSALATTPARPATSLAARVAPAGPAPRSATTSTATSAPARR